jgi:hypothetical protein
MQFRAGLRSLTVLAALTIGCSTEEPYNTVTETTDKDAAAASGSSQPPNLLKRGKKVTKPPGVQIKGQKSTQPLPSL